ncbi:MAG: SDR family oxidoreductase [Acidobacteriota bacterium]
MRFENKVVVVTGGASGIGRAAVELLAQRGAQVAVLDVLAKEGQEMVARLNREKSRALYFHTDVSQANQVENAVGETHRAWGRIDVLIASAGIQRYGTALTTSDAVWDEVLSVNLRGAWHAARACLPLMTQGGAIVNVASVQALATQQNVLAYTVSKHGLLGLTRSMAMDFAAQGIRVNAVCPGSVDTPMLRWAASLDPHPQSVLDACNQMHPIGRMARPEEVAEVILFLSHDRASFVTGAVWTVDGGLLTIIGGAPQTSGPDQPLNEKP